MTLLNLKSFGGLLVLLLVMAGLLFIPAGTVDFWQAWMFLAVYFALSLAITVYLMKKDPKLLERRMRVLVHLRTTVRMWAADASRVGLVSDWKRLKLKHMCFAVCRSSARERAFSGPKSPDAPEPEV
jgi:hypothetical protein